MFRKEGKLPPELVKHKVKAKLFENTELLNLWKANRKGISYQEDETGIVLRGAVDEILEKNGKLIVLDFKTRGFPLKEDTAHHYQDQMNMYNFLLRKNGYKTEDYAYLLFFHPIGIDKKGNFVFKTDLVEMKINIKHAEDLLKKAVEVLNRDMPEPAEGCEFCGWKSKA